MSYAHPVAMVFAIMLLFYVLKLGFVRFAMVHFKRRSGAFLWKRHVLLGKLTIALLLVGAAGGLAVTWLLWGSPGATQAHAPLGLAMAVVALWSLATGLILDRTRKPGNPLALAHGLGNGLLAALALAQIYTGVNVLRDFLW